MSSFMVPPASSWLLLILDEGWLPGLPTPGLGICMWSRVADRGLWLHTWGAPHPVRVPMRQIWWGADKRGGPGRAWPAWAGGGASGRLGEDGDPCPCALRALLCPGATEPWRSPLCGRELSRDAAGTLRSTWGPIKRKVSRCSSSREPLTSPAAAGKRFCSHPTQQGSVPTASSLLKLVARGSLLIA